MPHEILKALKSKNNITASYEVFDMLGEWIGDCTYQMNMNQDIGRFKEADAWRKSIFEINNLIIGIASSFINIIPPKLEEEKDGIDK